MGLLVPGWRATRSAGGRRARLAGDALGGGGDARGGGELRDGNPTEPGSLLVGEPLLVCVEAWRGLVLHRRRAAPGGVDVLEHRLDAVADAGEPGSDALVALALAGLPAPGPRPRLNSAMGQDRVQLDHPVLLASDDLDLGARLVQAEAPAHVGGQGQ